jgi:hypothetical protein
MILKGRCNDTERHNILSKMSDKSSLTLHREIKFPWGKKLYIKFCSIKKWNSRSVEVERNRKETQIEEDVLKVWVKRKLNTYC